MKTKHRCRLAREVKDIVTLLSVNSWQLGSTRCQQVAAGPGAFTKPVYRSTFRKLAGGMRFVHFVPARFGGGGGR